MGCLNSMAPTIAIVASGWSASRGINRLDCPCADHLGGDTLVYRVPYSLHCSFDEIEARGQYMSISLKPSFPRPFHFL